MKNLVLRIDDRLVHGQVTAGWVEPLALRRIVLVNDAVSGDEFEQQIYRAAVPQGVELVILPLAGAVEALEKLPLKKSICLVVDVADARRLVEQGIGVKSLNVGGVHAGPGRTEFLPFVHLSPTEIADCRAMAARGVKLEAQMLPGSREIDLIDLIERKAGTEPPAVFGGQG